MILLDLFFGRLSKKQLAPPQNPTQEWAQDLLRREGNAGIFREMDKLARDNLKTIKFFEFIHNLYPIRPTREPIQQDSTDCTTPEPPHKSGLMIF